MHSTVDTEHLLTIQVMENCLEICKSVNIVSIIYSLHARITILYFDPRVMTFYCLSAVMSYLGSLQLYVVSVIFLTV